MAGPAPGRPMSESAPAPLNTKSQIGACRIDDVVRVSPAAAVPVITKMPDPITAPMPRAIKLHGPIDFANCRPGSCESETSLSMLLVRSSWFTSRPAEMEKS